jgi:hypothetical protein
MSLANFVTVVGGELLEACVAYPCFLSFFLLRIVILLSNHLS